jgi:3-phenylpropionate/cinnamic acid dioxygenase small subunit
MSTRDEIAKRLAQHVVIGAEQDATTGAQAVGAGHTPRTHYADRALPARSELAHRPGTDLQSRVEAFLYHQAELLDGKHWRAYLDLFTDDGVYWAPIAPEQTDWIDSPSIFAEDRLMMEIRMGRVTHPNAWSQAPMWGTSHIVGNVVVESTSSDEIVVRSRFQMMELRRDSVRHFGGTYRHTLLHNGSDDFRIRLQRVDIMNGQAPYDYVLQVWV